MYVAILFKMIQRTIQRMIQNCRSIAFALNRSPSDSALIRSADALDPWLKYNAHNNLFSSPRSKFCAEIKNNSVYEIVSRLN